MSLLCDVAQSQMNKDLKRVDQWLADNRIYIIPNVKKTKSMVIVSRLALKRANDIEIYLDNEILDVPWSLHLTISVFE